MNDERQRIEIAEACGWKSPDHTDCKKEKKNMVIGDRWWLSPEGELEHSREIPNYLNDLNAMHEAEKVLNSEQMYEYWDRLSDLCWHDEHEIMTATAAVRAIAFLRTIGKWEWDAGDEG